MQVTFVLMNDAPLAQLEQLDPDRDWRQFVTGERAWILQTYLRLRSSGAPVQLATALPDTGIAVFSSKQRRLLRKVRPRAGVVLVGIREDVGEALIADYEVVQNPSQADGQRRFLLPFWPQPGLIPRDATRGTRVENIAYKGFENNLHPGLRGSAWRDSLQAQHFGWFTDAVSYTRDASQFAGLAWNDFSTIDVILAVRPPDAHLHPHKPATKLYNAWLAGVPAVLGPEVAYRQLRRTELDYIEANTADDASRAILRLRSEPALYRAMVDNGHHRAAEFSHERLRQQWSTLLFDTLPAIAATDRRSRFWQGRSLWRKELARRAARALRLWQ
ncbi:MAG TPA: hypothetical protein VJS42_16880 [Steroidobacteraceae bacterium]|nr:hypothetical protein [Steroidobacteraceae bacterium]